MLATLALLFSFIINPVFSEVELPAQTDHVLVKTGVNEFSILTPQGYYVVNHTRSSEFIEYKEPTPLNNRVQLKELKLSYLDKTPYLLSPIEGHLYQFKDSTLTRIDRDVRKGYDYKPLFFRYKGQFFTLGGDVIFNHKNGLRVFNWDSETWQLKTTSGELPPGVKNGLYQLIDNELWVFHANAVDNNLDETFIQNAYSLNLETFKWKKRGIINPTFIKESENIPLDAVISPKGLLVYNRANSKVFLVDIPSNSFMETELSSIDQFDSNVVYLENQQFNYTVSVGNQIQFRSTDTLNEEVDDYFIRNHSIFKGKEFELSSISALLMFGFLGYIFLSRRKFKLTHEALSNGLKKIPLTEEEVEFLKILAKKKIVLNNEAMDIIHDPNTTYDANIKRKNNLVSKIERKLKKTFKEVLFSRERYKDDMRHTAFYLKNGYSIKCLNTEDE